MNQRKLLMLCTIIPVLISAAAGAASFTGIKLGDGTIVQYGLVLPDQFDPNKSYPAILAMPPGRQTIHAARSGLERVWESEARKRGYIVISPLAPDGDLFFKGGERIFPEFLDLMLKILPVENGKFHLGGISNGGLSAFRIALLHRRYFRSLTVLPGFQPRPTKGENLSSLKGLTIQMYVGANDDRWRRQMLGVKSELDRLGIPSHFEVLPNEGHRIKSLTGPGAARIFDRLE